MSEQAEPSYSDVGMGWPNRRDGAEQALKSLAKHLARSATAGIDDRHVRAQVRATCYNQTLDLLRQVDERWRADRHRLRRLLLASAAAAALAGVVLTAVLLI